MGSGLLRTVRGMDTTTEPVSLTGQSSGTILRRQPGTVVAVVAVLFYGVKVIVNAATAGTFGVDFAVFHAGGTSIRLGGYDAAYDADQFSVLLRDWYIPSLEEANVTHFISTPPFGWAAQALTYVSFTTALWL